MSRAPDTVRVLVLPAAGAGGRDWLLPAAAVAEIVNAKGLAHSGPEVPDWLIGTREWRGIAVPAVRIARPPKVHAGSDGPRSHPYLAICLGAGGNPKLPFFAIESPGLPRMDLVGAEALAEDGESDELPFALALLRLNGQPTALADLESLERRLLVARVRV